MNYNEFLQNKLALAREGGLQCDPAEVNPILKPHQRDLVCWGVRGGRRAFFTRFGLGKTMIQLETARLVLKHGGGTRALIVMPLGVRQEFKRDAGMLGLTVTFIRSIAEAIEPGIYLTNYETVRDGKLDPTAFDVVSLDEASILRGFGGTKTFREMMGYFEGSGKYRFVATATPSPNEYIEILAYAAFLDIMDVGQAKTRFFKRDSTKADQLTIHAHKEREFWLWVASWAIFLQAPSDLGYSDEGYEYPELEVHWHEIPSDHSGAGHDRDGQGRLLRNAALGVQDAAREKRDSLSARIDKLLELREIDPLANRLIWHDLEAERHAIEKAIPSSVSVYGNQDLEDREQAIIDFSDGRIHELAAKPVLAGAGCNFQRFCHWAIFLGIGFKFNDFIQAVHRIHRFLQTDRVRIDLIYTESEREIKKVLETKWQNHNRLVEKMTDIIREYGLRGEWATGEMSRSIGVKRREETGRNWRMILNDSVLETADMETESVDLVLTSIPFSTQYEYTPSFNDFGHNESNGAFFEQMDYLTPHLLRVLKPGRVAVIHVKDRIIPGGLTGLGFQTVYPMHADCIAHYTRHGFAYMGMKTVVTDVVRENNQTYRLGWTEQCKDATKMGWGMPEYLLLFRKPQTDRTNGYGDFPVKKDKKKYSLARWQIDAAGFERSSGDRLLAAEDLEGVTHERIYKLWRAHSLGNVYDYEHHVALGEALQASDRLPVTFTLLPAHSDHPDVWTDVARMRTLNGTQKNRNKQMHLCPMQFDIADRIIVQFSQEGELVFDPFSGLGTVPMCAVKLGRRGLGIELSESYWLDSLYYLRQAETSREVPTLFKLNEMAQEQDVMEAQV